MCCPRSATYVTCMRVACRSGRLGGGGGGDVGCVEVDKHNT